jgi:hypothetical protein
MLPQLGFGGGTPSPRKLSAASAMIDTDTLRNEKVSRFGRIFGATWRRRILHSFEPAIRAAAKNVAERIRNVFARANRPTAGIEKNEIA